MTSQEVTNDYRRAVVDHLRLYNPVLNLICPQRLLESYFSLPFHINLTLFVGSLLTSMVLILALGDALCNTKATQASCLSDKAITLAILVALATGALMIAITYGLSRNYLSFLQRCRDTITSS